MSDDTSITIKIKSPTPSLPSDLSFPVRLDSTVLSLKSRILESLSSPEKDGSIVLIYRGKILLDADTIIHTVGGGAYGEGGTIKDGDTIAFHAILRPAPGLSPDQSEPKPSPIRPVEAAPAEPTPPQPTHPTLPPSAIPPPSFPSTSLDSPAPLQPRPWLPQFTSLTNTPATLSHASILSGLTLTSTTTSQSFRVARKRTPEGGFLLVGPNGATAIIYPDTLSASQQGPLSLVGERTYRLRGATLLSGTEDVQVLRRGRDGVMAPAPILPPAGVAVGARARVRLMQQQRDRTNELWLALKLGALLFLLTDRHDMRRTLGMWFAAILIFVTQTGRLRTLYNTLTSLYTDLRPPLHRPPVPATQNPPLDPSHLATRLLHRQNQPRGLAAIYHNVNRTIGLFLASLVPDLGERRVRIVEAAAMVPRDVGAEREGVRENPAGGERRGEEEQGGAPAGVELDVDAINDVEAVDGGRGREREVLG